MKIKEVVLNPFIELWNGIATVLPKILIAFIIFWLGITLAKFAYKLVMKGSRKLKLYDLVKPLAGAFERAGYKLHPGKILGFLVRWFVIIGALVISLDIIGLPEISDLLKDIVVVKIPQIIIAIVVLAAGIILGDFVKKIVKGSTKMLNVKSAAFLANLARVSIVIFTSLTALNIVGFNSQIINILFMGIVFMLALAGGLAFGLGGQRAASEIIDEVREKMHK